MAAHNPFSYIPGTGKGAKAEYKIGKAFVPAAVISRLEKELVGQPEHKKSMIFFSRLEKKYGKFLEAVDAAKIDYVTALGMMAEVKPRKSQSTGVRASKVSLTVKALSKGICKRFKGTPEEVIDGFLLAVNDPEFKKEALTTIKGYKKEFGLDSQDHIKTSNRVASPKALKGLAESRAKKKAAKGK